MQALFYLLYVGLNPELEYVLCPEHTQVKWLAPLMKRLNDSGEPNGITATSQLWDFDCLTIGNNCIHECRVNLECKPLP